MRVARARLKQRLDEVAADRQGLKKFVGPTGERLRVAELLDALEADARLRGLRSLRKFSSHLKPVRAALGDRRVPEITATVVDRYIQNQIAAGKAPATVNREIGALRQAFRLAVRRGELSTVPPIRHLREDNARSGFFERAEFDAVVAALPDDLQNFCRFGYYTGWRRGEIATLTWADVDRAGQAIRLRAVHAKNGHGRTVMLEGELQALIEPRWADRLLKGPEGTTRMAERVFHRAGAPV